MTDNDTEGARLARYAEAINRHQEDMAGESVPLDPSLARAVLAVADAELDEVRAEVERLREDRDEWKAAAVAANQRALNRAGYEAVVRDVEALHRRRPWDFAKDPVFFGQSEYPDQCAHCRRAWPCETAAALARSQAPQAPAEQEGRWTCPSCGGRPGFHRTNCLGGPSMRPDTTADDEGARRG